MIVLIGEGRCERNTIRLIDRIIPAGADSMIEIHAVDVRLLIIKGAGIAGIQILAVDILIVLIFCIVKKIVDLKKHAVREGVHVIGPEKTGCIDALLYAYN